MPQPVRSKENARSTNDLLADIPNPNITLFHETGSWCIYVALVIFARALVGLFFHEIDVAWTITNTIHNAVCWGRGCECCG